MSIKDKKITTIIPAYNEEKNIANVIKILKKVSEINEIIVVDDGSKDKTAEIISKIPNIILIKLPTNNGKTKTVIKGVERSGNTTVMFFDADLNGMKVQYIKNLIKVYNSGYDMVIMDKGKQTWVFKDLLNSVPALSGVRILDKEMFNRIEFYDTDRFELENRINSYYIQNNLKFAISDAPTVSDPRKYIKYAFVNGLFLDLKSGVEVMTSQGIDKIPRMLKDWKYIKRQDRF